MIFRKKETEFPLFTQRDSLTRRQAEAVLDAHNRQIIDRVNGLGIPKDKLLVVGGSALSAAGIRQANDVDLITTPDVMIAIHKSGQSPSGVRLRSHPKRTHVYYDPTPPVNSLKVEILSEFDPSINETAEQFTERFLEQLATFPTIEGVYFSSLSRMLEQYKTRLKSGVDDRARRDHRLVSAYLSSTVKYEPKYDRK